MVDSISDREMLELAALAAGIKYKWKQEDYAYGDFGIIPKGWRRCWNPLRSDEDAFRLMVQLKLRINYDTVIEYDVVEVLGPEQDDFSCDCTTYTIEDDQCAAVRRAIVHAAAKIGKQLVDRK